MRKVIAVLIVAVAAAGGFSMADCGASHASAKSDIVDTAVAAGSFDTLVAAVKAAGLVEALKGEGPFTVFAPTDEAFGKLPAGTIDTLLKPENKDQLTAILTYHVVAGKITSAEVKPGRVETLQGGKLSVSEKQGSLMIDQAKVVTADIETSNGVIHVIDAVIMPKEMRSAADSSRPVRNAQNLR